MNMFGIGNKKNGKCFMIHGKHTKLERWSTFMPLDQNRARPRVKTFWNT